MHLKVIKRTNCQYYFILNTTYVTVLGRYASQQSDQSYDGDVFTNHNNNDINTRPTSLYAKPSSRNSHHHDENNNKKIPEPPPLPPMTPTTPRSATLKSTKSDFDTYNRQESKSYCKHRTSSQRHESNEFILLLARKTSVNDQNGQVDDMQEELKSVLTLFRERRRNLDIVKTPEIFIQQTSTPEEVAKWLTAKGFSDRTVKKLRGLTGNELFALNRQTLEEYCGVEEGKRLASQITIQRNVSGVSSLNFCLKIV